ncbi:MAG: isoprenylcysteine carboxylmethyltransferase family protein [Deltaproteobacteria bacterium]|nr:isoprenylcysteine carboxylmethyltransferase family protein [Deltaproteobacteria bacterium]
MTKVLLIGLAVYGLVAFGWRSFVQWRRTGSTGFRGLSGKAFSGAWIGGVSFVVALLAVVLAPVADLAELPRLFDLPTPLAACGFALFSVGLAITVLSQVHMGDSWRIGVDAGERTGLVHTGLFRVVRNPIFSAMWLTVAGVLLVVPNVLSVLALVALTAALELQVRLVEEPYLLRTHGDAYRRYAAAVGRFVPGLGRLR